jgi:quercetin dioxygenase-like cupin family protein
MRFQRFDPGAATPISGEQRAYFDGDVSIQRLHADPPVDGVELLAVHFAQGARTRPHIHPVEQSLHVVSGEGTLAVEGRRWPLRPGDVVVVPAGLWHWHGATPDAPMCHISIKQPGTTDWNQPDLDWPAYMDVPLAAGE